MKTSSAGRALIEKYEGLKLRSYQDGAGVWTIGYGHTHDVHIGQYETQAQADADLCKDIADAEAAVARLVMPVLLQCEFDALVSFTYNEGQGRLASSTLLKELNTGYFDEAAAEFLKWDIIDGKKSTGLDARRADERRMFLGQFSE